MIQLTTLFIVATLAADAGHSALSAVGYTVAIAGTFFWLIGLLALAAASDDK